MQRESKPQDDAFYRAFRWFSHQPGLHGGPSGTRLHNISRYAIKVSQLNPLHQELLHLLQRIRTDGDVLCSEALETIGRSHIGIWVIPCRNGDNNIDNLSSGQSLEQFPRFPKEPRSRLTTSSAPSSQLLSPSRRKLPTARMDRTSNAIMKISKLRSIGLPRAHATRTTSGALKRAVWIDGPRQW